MTVADPSSAPPPQPFASLPSVFSAVAAAREHGVALAEGPLTTAVQTEIERIRNLIAAGARPTRDAVTADILAALTALERPRLARVLNATGVVIHTN
ncbi:MAG: hypothetical protein H0U10_06535, partial [Chloroflexia bacterium]|nr:hypothetical protein [Chloroflexia bacterium]